MSSFVCDVLFAGRLPKSGEPLDGCQDAVACDAAAGRFAVADGVGNSFFPAQWAELLVNRFCRSSDADTALLFVKRDWRRWLRPIQAEWQAEVRARVAEKPGMRYAHLRNSLGMGEPAAAAFAGLAFGIDEDEACWRAVLVGDTCLMRLRGTALESWLLNEPAAFSNATEFFGSTPAFNTCEPTYIDGACGPGDAFVLASDALSRYLLEARALGGETWRRVVGDLLSLRDGHAFEAWIAAARLAANPRLREDDVALVVARAAEPAKAELVEAEAGA